MRKFFLFCLAGALLVSVSAMAQNKVVVVPLGSSSAKGANGQVQYNDNGMTAGAEVYYDKATGKLELPGELRTVDGAGNNRLWGKGRPETGLLTHTDPNGYCTTSAGIKYALSSLASTWDNVDEICPVGTWVCSKADLPTQGSCDIVPFVTYLHLECDGASIPASPVNQTMQYGWISNAYPGNSIRSIGRLRYSSDFLNDSFGFICVVTRAWCCWE